MQIPQPRNSGFNILIWQQLLKFQIFFIIFFIKIVLFWLSSLWSLLDWDLFTKNESLVQARAGIDYESSYGKVRPNDTIMKLQRTTPYYKRNRAHICSFYIRGECTRGAECPYRHEMPVTGELSQQNIKDRYYGYVWFKLTSLLMTWSLFQLFFLFQLSISMYCLIGIGKQLKIFHFLDEYSSWFLRHSLGSFVSCVMTCCVAKKITNLQFPTPPPPAKSCDGSACRSFILNNNSQALFHQVESNISQNHYFT